jgi:hypothetical protein
MELDKPKNVYPEGYISPELRVKPNLNLGKTQITDKIRVSSAAIFYENWFGVYYQYETWIFSTDPIQKSVMVIHGTCGGDIDEKMVVKTQHIHERMANNLLKKFKDGSEN